MRMSRGTPSCPMTTSNSAAPSIRAARASAVYSGSRLVTSLGTETPPPTRYTPGEKNTAIGVVYGGGHRSAVSAAGTRRGQWNIAPLYRKKAKLCVSVSLIAWVEDAIQGVDAAAAPRSPAGISTVGRDALAASRQALASGRNILWRNVDPMVALR